MKRHILLLVLFAMLTGTGFAGNVKTGDVNQNLKLKIAMHRLVQLHVKCKSLG